MRAAIDAYVTAWHAQNKEGVDIGRIHVPMLGDVDVFPDELERTVYRKVLALLVTNRLEVELTVAGVPMRLRPNFAAAEATTADTTPPNKQQQPNHPNHPNPT